MLFTLSDMHNYERKTENCDASIFKVFKILVINYLNDASLFYYNSFIEELHEFINYRLNG